MPAIRELNANFARKAAALEAVAAKDSLIQERAQALVDVFNQPYAQAEDLLAALHASQRVLLMDAAGVGQNAALLAELDASTSPK